MIKTFKTYWQQYFEISVWSIALMLLFFMDTNDGARSLCMFRFIGFQHCPGCGLGHSIHQALHLQFGASFQQHPLGIIGVLIILNRIKQLTFKTKPSKA